MDLDARYRTFIGANPHVIPTLVRMAREEKARGKTRIGAKALIERLRWESSINTKGEPWRLNNNHTSRLVRDVMRAAPDVADLFETRALAEEPEAVPAGQQMELFG